MIGMIAIGFIMVTIGLYMSHMSSEYDVTYSESDLESYNNLQEMNTLVQEIEEQSNFEEKTGIVDIIGSYITDGYNVLMLTKQSYNTFDTMSNQAIEDSNMGAAGTALRVSISAIVIILIVIAVIVSAIMKWPL